MNPTGREGRGGGRASPGQPVGTALFLPGSCLQEKEQWTAAAPDSVPQVPHPNSVVSLAPSPRTAVSSAPSPQQLCVLGPHTPHTQLCVLGPIPPHTALCPRAPHPPHSTVSSAPSPPTALRPWLTGMASGETTSGALSSVLALGTGAGPAESPSRVCNWACLPFGAGQCTKGVSARLMEEPVPTWPVTFRGSDRKSLRLWPL